ncbi:MAG: hypothetical protein DWQ37_01295 [Planctomycetota bacterium]|nr:MAG: hypothetical protein DWQ37_01295 [Planctomycetota bacterium]
MPIETKVQLMNDGKVLMVFCDKEPFAKIIQSVCDSIGYTEPVSDVVDLQVSDRSPRERRAPISRLRDSIALAGCGVVALLMVFVFSLGLTRVAEMFWE